MNSVIACDLGSNTLRIVQMNCESGEREIEFERIVRTAKDLHLTGCIGKEAIVTISEALKEASKLFDFENIPTTCITTEAMRQATNAKEFIELIKRTFGLHFKIIDGEQEALYTQIGVERALRRLQLPSSHYLLMDLGGGSMELTCKGEKESFSQSFPIGIVTIAERYKSLEAIKEGLEKELLGLHSFAKKVFTCKGLTFIATAGTPTTVAAYLQGMDYEHYEHQKVTGTRLTVKEYENALISLLVLSEEERIKWVGVGRSDLIIAGIIIVQEIMTYFGLDECLVIDDGLREGVALSKCNKKVILEKSSDKIG